MTPEDAIEELSDHWELDDEDLTVLTTVLTNFGEERYKDGWAEGFAEGAESLELEGDEV